MGPPKILIFGESGGASRLNADEVSSPCDLVTEREITGSLRVHKQRLSIDLYISLCELLMFAVVGLASRFRPRVTLFFLLYICSLVCGDNGLGISIG